MAKLLLILFCCFIWVGADPFFFNIQSSYVPQPTQSSSRVAVSQSSNLGSGGIFSKWFIGPQLLKYKFFGWPTQRPRPTQRPVIQIDPVYVPVDLDKEYASTTSTEVPAEEIETTKKSTTSTAYTTSTTSSYEYSKPTTTEGTTTSFTFTESSSTTSESTTEAETIKPTTYRPITSPPTQKSTTTTSTTEVSVIDIGFEIDSSEDKEPSTTSTTSTTSTSSTTSTTTEENKENVQTTESTISLPLTYLPPLMKSRKLSGPSVGFTSTSSISSGVLPADPLTAGPPLMKSPELSGPSVGLTSTSSISSGVLPADPLTTGLIFSGAQGEISTVAASSSSSSAGGNARPFDIISFRGTIADEFTGEGLIPESKSVEVESNGIDPRVFYYY